MTTDSETALEIGESGRPVAYERGLQAFMGHELFVAPGALIPRKETELLARVAIAELSTRAGALRLIEMCWGSGYLACALAVALPTAQVWAADLTEGAVLFYSSNLGWARTDRSNFCSNDPAPTRPSSSFRMNKASPASSPAERNPTDEPCRTN